MSNSPLNSDMLGDPVIKVKQSAQGSGTGRGTKRFQVPLYGTVGISSFLAWVVLLLLAPPVSLFARYGLALSTVQLSYGVRTCWLMGAAIGGLVGFFAANVFVKQEVKSGSADVGVGHLSAFNPTGGAEVAVCTITLILTSLGALSLLLCVPLPALYVVWTIAGFGGGWGILLWWWHVAAISNQRQTLMALACSCCAGGLFVLVGLLFRSDALLGYMIFLPVFSMLIFRIARRRVLRRSISLAANPHEQVPHQRFLFKELLPSTTILFGFGFLLAATVGSLSGLLPEEITNNASVLENLAAAIASADTFLPAGLSSTMASLVFCCCILATGIIMLVLLLGFSRSASFMMLGFAVPVAALCLLGYSLGNTVLSVVALACFSCYFGCFEISHVANVARNTKCLYPNYRKSVGLFIFFDVVAFMLGWLLALIPLWSQLSVLQLSADALFFPFSLFSNVVFSSSASIICILIVLCLIASAVSFCLFTAMPHARHLPFNMNDTASQNTSVASDAGATDSIEGARSGIRSLFASLLSMETAQLEEDYASREATGGLLVASEQGVSGGPLDTNTKPEEPVKQTLSEILDMLSEEHGLSKREAEVLTYLARGHNTQSIAQKLVVSNNTVKTHVRNIYAKFDVHSQQELVDVIEKTLLS